MKYYKLSGSSDSKIIGVRNGVHQGEIKWKHFQDSNSEKKISSYFINKLGKSLDKIEEIDFEIEYVEAYKSAKMTDFFMFTPALYGIYFFVNDKIVNVFSKFKLPVHNFIPVNIYQNEKQYKYWALYIPQYYGEESIVFEKSIFNRGTDFNKNYISLKNFKEYKEIGYVSIEKLVFNNRINKSLDLFRSSFLGHSYLISETLKSALEKVDASGIKMAVSIRPEIVIE